MDNKLMYEDYMLMVEYATKAPSGHNTQPWLFNVNQNRISIYPDFAKSLPVVDFDNRELFISLGCAVENLCLKANAMGYFPDIAVSEKGVISITLQKSNRAIPNELVDEIKKRQTNRSLYNKTVIPDQLLHNIIDELPAENNINIYTWQRQSIEFEQISRYIQEGNNIQMNDTAFKEELLAWIRFNKKHSESTNNGISYAALGAPNLPLFITKPIVKSALNSRKQNKTDLKKIDSSSHLVLITSQNNNLLSWINTGRFLQRFLLLLTKEGIAHAYLNQPCELPMIRQRLHNELPINKESPQIILRIGYGKTLPYSGRKPLEQVVTICPPDK